ncbi:MAG: efflux RND transporter periplasmic adaptor subunit [Thermoanaerobaculia bacterium]
MDRKKLIIGVAVVAIVVAAIAGSLYFRDRNTEQPASSADKKEQAKDVYYCPMHPSVQSDEPGNCPICGMSLVKRTGSPAHDAASHGADVSLQRISLSPEQRVTANVQTTTVQLATGSGDIVTSGRVTFDERRVSQVTSYTAGRIEKLFVNFTGDSVKRGQPVATIYSPELYATQQEYLLALGNRERMRKAGFADARTAADDLVDSTRRRLALFGMSPSQIGQLERGGKTLFTTTIVSPVSGVVTNKGVVPQQYVAQGQPLLEVTDLSTVWVEADVYEQQLPNVSVGQEVAITTPSAPGFEFSGRVSFIQPVLAGATRTAQVRIELPNPDLQLKPDMYVSVKLTGAEQEAHVMVPASAVVDRGLKQFVWVQVEPGIYEPREITPGGRHGAQIVILSGIDAGDVIVTEGGFLLDSEAQLRSITSGGAHEEH